MGITIDNLELLALKKIAIISHALGEKIGGTAGREQAALTRVLLDVCNRADIDNARAKATAQIVLFPKEKAT